MKASLRLGRFDFWTLITLVGFVVVILLLILPLFNIFKSSFIDKETGALALSNYREFFSKTYYTSAILNSLIVSVGGTLGALVFGIPLAFFTSRCKSAPFRYFSILATSCSSSS